MDPVYPKERYQVSSPRSFFQGMTGTVTAVYDGFNRDELFTLKLDKPVVRDGQLVSKIDVFRSQVIPA